MKQIKKICSLAIAAAITVSMTGALTAGAVDVNTTIDISSSDETVKSFVSAEGFTVGDIKEGGKLRITYTASDSSVQAHLVLSPDWVQVTGVTAVAVEGETDTYYLDYSYESITSALTAKSKTVSDITGVLVETWGLWSNTGGTEGTGGNVSCPVTVKTVEWIDPETPSENPTEAPSETPTEDPASYTEIDDDDSTTDIPAYTSAYTVPSSGSDIVSGGKIRVEYTSTSETVPVLALKGTGTDHSWVNVSWSWTQDSGWGDRPNNMGTLDNGHSYIDYPYDMLATAYGSDFSDYSGVVVQVWSGDAKIYGVTWIAPAAETATEATAITDTVTDSSLGYLSDVTISDTANLSGAVWRITNSENKTKDITAKTDATTVTNGTIRVGLVITANALGGNTVSKVEFVY